MITKCTDYDHAYQQARKIHKVKNDNSGYEVNDEFLNKIFCIKCGDIKQL